MFAYIDPGSGSQLFQLLIAGIMAATLTLTQWRHKAVDGIKRAYRRIKEKKIERRDK